MGTTKSLGQKDLFDKFYTKEETVKRCINLINFSRYNLIIEPSAGNGAFLKYLPQGSIGYDILPENENIVKQDFLELINPSEKEILTIGNPPYGAQSKMAFSFFDKAMEFSQTVAFIVPRSFQKISYQNRINLNFWLEKELILPENSFTFYGKDYKIPTVFQIWERKNKKREKIKLPTNTPYLQFVKEKENSDFRIQRVGGRAGKAFLDKDGAISSNYYVKNISKISTEEFIEKINKINFSSLEFTVGPKSLPKGELCYEINKIFE